MKYVGVATKTLEIQNICVNLCVSCCLVFYNIRLPTYVVVELKMTPNQTPIHGTTKLLHLCSR